MNGCAYVLTATTTVTEGGEKHFTAHTNVECPEGKQIEIHLYLNAGHTETLCTYDIKASENQGLTGITLTNAEGEPQDIIAALNVTGIKVTRTTGSEALCGKESNTATYAGEATLQLTMGGKLVGGAISG